MLVVAIHSEDRQLLAVTYHLLDLNLSLRRILMSSEVTLWE